MTPPVITFPLADREAWEARRPRYLNASERVAEFNIHPYITLAQLTAHKRGLATLGADQDSPVIRRGHALEDDAIDEVRKQYPDWELVKCDLQFVDEKQRIAASPDYFARDPNRAGIGVIQVKVVTKSKHAREWLDETPPMHILLQLAQEMMLVPDCTWGAVAALVIGEWAYEAHVYLVDRNTSAEMRLRTSAAEFWRMVDAGDDPVIDYERDAALIALLYPNEVVGKVLDLSSDNELPDLLQRREILRDTAKDIEKRLKATETEIKAKVGDAETAILNGWRVTLKTQHRDGYTVEPTSFRVLRVKRLDPAPAIT